MRNLSVNANLVCSADATCQYVSLCHKGWTIRKVVAGVENF